MKSFDLNSLNSEQQQALLQTEGAVLVTAGAGSGKTRLLTHRIAYLLSKGVSPYSILAITFTNKATREMSERVQKMCEDGEKIWISTFHSMCVRILRRYIDRLGYDTNFTIYDTDDSKSVMKEICKRLNIDTKIYKERALLSEISSAKDELISPEEYNLNTMGDFSKRRVAEAYREYQDTLKKNNALDFDDLIAKTVELFRMNPDVLDSYQERFRYISVDEYQDTNTAQFELVRLLSRKYRNLCVVGDDDQSIYKFRGANIRNILDFEKVFPEAKVVKLEQNYRSTQTILDAANAVIRNNTARKDKRLWTDQGEGEKVHFRRFDSAYEEAEFIASDIARKKKRYGADYRDFAVLYRTNAQSRLLEERFIMEGIPYDVVGGVNFYARKEIKDVLARVQDYADGRAISFFDALCEADQIMAVGKGAAKIKPFTTMIRAFRSKMAYYSLEELVQDVLESTGYVKELEDSDEEDAQDRIQNIDEFISKVVAYESSHDEPTLSGFLEEVALVADVDNVDGADNRVLLMTLHSAKGLEFPYVYLSGMEDGIFPSYMTITSDDPSAIEEERRLAYVGITRAKEELTLTCARQRMVRGETQYNPVSRFIREVPEDLMDERVPVFRKSPELEEFEENQEIRERFRSAPYGGNYGTDTVTDFRPRAVVKPKKTAEENRPFIARGLDSLSGVNGLNRGGQGKAAALEYGEGDRVRHMKYGEGMVRTIEDGPRDYRVTVDFDKAGTKIMYAAFAKLKKI